ncbi:MULTISPECIES: cysteine hydrolase family protein [Fusobacterium]|uniref:cysteine hydrolase family protein n=1 Tax=Fusobacterium TaxID=848 RepID=UPI001476C31D|nr:MULTISPECIES: cysteine hydrolase family protein [Fusobacterium]NME35137.1 cysteine hydrolase [Fusobacterium sp. FSA-380-WT-3A]
MILLVVDTQKLLVNKNLYNFESFIENIKKLINIARENKKEIVYIIHDDGADSELTQGKIGFEIYEEFKSKDKEKIFIKTVNSAFKDTGLKEYLKDKNEKEIIVVGLQTDKCIDATIKSGFENNFKIYFTKETNSTVDNEYLSGEKTVKYYNNFIWNNRYGKLISMEEAINKLKS